MRKIRARRFYRIFRNRYERHMRFKITSYDGNNLKLPNSGGAYTFAEEIFSL